MIRRKNACMLSHCWLRNLTLLICDWFPCDDKSMQNCKCKQFVIRIQESGLQNYVTGRPVTQAQCRSQPTVLRTCELILLWQMNSEFNFMWKKFGLVALTVSDCLTVSDSLTVAVRLAQTFDLDFNVTTAAVVQPTLCNSESEILWIRIPEPLIQVWKFGFEVRNISGALAAAGVRASGRAGERASGTRLRESAAGLGPGGRARRASGLASARAG